MTTTKGERKFVRNMSAGGALGATAGSAGAAIATKGRVKFRPLGPAVTGAAAGAAAGGGAVALRMKNRKKVSKAMSISAFGIEHDFSKAVDPQRTQRGVRRGIRSMNLGALGSLAGTGAALASKGKVKVGTGAIAGGVLGAATGASLPIQKPGISKALTRRQKQQTKQGAQIGALYGGALAGGHGALQAIDRRKMYHAASMRAGHGKGVARGAMALHAGSKGAAGAAVGAAGFGAIGLASAKKKLSPVQETRRKKAVIS